MMIDLDLLSDERVIEIAKALGYDPGYEYMQEEETDYYTVDLRKVSDDQLLDLRARAVKANENLRKAQKDYMINLYNWLKDTSCVRYAGDKDGFIDDLDWCYNEN